MSTKLLELIKKNDHKDIETFLESNKLWFEDNDEYDIVLGYCVENDLINIIQLFIDHDLILKDFNKGIMSILLYATSIDMLIFLIDNDITIDVLNKNIHRHVPVINFLLSVGREFFLFLVKMGLDLNVEGIFIKHKDEAEILFACNPDYETLETWFFKHKKEHHKFNFIEHMIIKYPEICAQFCNKNNMTLFYCIIAELNISVDVFTLLIDNGLDINMQRNDGITGLYAFVNYKRRSLIMLLFERGADINHVSNEGKNALFYTNDTSIANLLLDLGIDIYQKDNDNNYPINYIYDKLDISTKIRFFDTCSEDKKQQIVDDTIRLQSLEPLRTLIKEHNIIKYVDKSEYKNLLYKK